MTIIIDNAFGRCYNSFDYLCGMSVNIVKQKKTAKYAGDLIYTVMATVVMNVVLQIIIYPLITRFHGEAVTGNILYFIGVIYIVPQALGTALNNTRLVSRKSCDVTNSDLTHLLVISSALSALICAGVGFYGDSTPLFSVAYGVFSAIYMLRVYAQVEFRLVLNFKKYFMYYIIISVGYLLGFGLYMLTNVWLLIFIIGEAAALAYSLFKGNIFKKNGKSSNCAQVNKIFGMLFLSTIVRDCVNQFDKVILKLTISAEVVTQYHVVSLIAKTIQMLVQPVNSLILSYLTVKDSGLTKKQLLKFTGLSLGFGGVFYGVCIAGTPVFIKLFYPDLYSAVMPYNLLVNLGLILGFVATLFMSILLTQEKTALHMAIQCVWGVCYIVAAYFAVLKFRLWGIAVVTLLANALKLLVAIFCTFLSKPASKKLSKQ